MAKSYQVWNGASVTTAAPAAVATGTSVKTMIQLSTSSSKELRVVEWWWGGDASAAATPGTVELLVHGTGAATVTAYGAGDILKYEPNAVASLVTLGTGNSVGGGHARLDHEQHRPAGPADFGPVHPVSARP
jgi:hypothetical protein